MLRKLLTLVFSLGAASAAAADTLYTLTAPLPATKLECWSRHFKKYDEIVGYSKLGHFFLRARAIDEYIVLHPFSKGAKSYGVFPSVARFEEKVLKDPGFAGYVLRADHVAQVRKRAGPLKTEELYIPEPYPFLGGSGEPSTYGKGNVWVFMHIVAQMQGLCD